MLFGPIRQTIEGRMLANRISLNVLLASAYTSSHSATAASAISSQGVQWAHQLLTSSTELLRREHLKAASISVGMHLPWLQSKK